MKVVVIGGGISGLAAMRRLVQLLPDAELTLVERQQQLGGKITTERTSDGFVIEGGPDSFLSRKARGVGLCEELGIELVGRRPEYARSYLRRGAELRPLPEGLTGLIPADLDALESTKLLTEGGRERLAHEVEIPPRPEGEDESIASFMTRRLGREAYESIVEPLTTGIYGGDGEQLSMEATFPQLRALELEYGSIIRGIASQAPTESPYPPFVAPKGGMASIVDRLRAELEGRVITLLGTNATRVHRRFGGYVVDLADGDFRFAHGVVIAVPAQWAGHLLYEMDVDWLAEDHFDMASSPAAVITLGFDEAAVAHPLDGYGYLVPRTEASDVLACTWTSRKWAGHAPDGKLLLRVFIRRFDWEAPDPDLIEVAQTELRLIGIDASPELTRVHRWSWLDGMPQYVLGHPERVARIEERLVEHPGLAVAGAAYRGVGVPDCIASGEAAAESVARALAGAAA